MTETCPIEECTYRTFCTFDPEKDEHKKYCGIYKHIINELLKDKTADGDNDSL